MQVNGLNSGNMPGTDSVYRSDGRSVAGSERRPESAPQKAVDGDSVTISYRQAVPNEEKKVPGGENPEGTEQDSRGRGKLGDSLREYLAKTRDFFRRLWNGTGAEATPVSVPAEREKGADTLWERFKLKVYTATGHLAKRFGGDPALQTGADQSRNQQGNELENDRQLEKEGDKKNIQKDNSYLMDSYDRTGKYSKLGQDGSGPRNISKSV